MGSNGSGKVFIAIIGILCQHPKFFPFMHARRSDMELSASIKNAFKHFFHLSWLNVAYLHQQDLGLINLHYLRIIALVIIVLSRSQDGYCEYMADGTKALLLKKIFSEAEKVCMFIVMAMVLEHVHL